MANSNNSTHKNFVVDTTGEKNNMSNSDHVPEKTNHIEETSKEDSSNRDNQSKSCPEPNLISDGIMKSNSDADRTFPTQDTNLLKVLETDAHPLLSTANEKPVDEVDALPSNLRYSNFDLTYTLISVLTYLFDLVMDCAVAYYFYHLAAEHGIYHYWYFGLTVSFVLLPSLTMTGFSLRWYLMDGDNEHLPRVPLWRWILRLFVLILQLAPVLRYVDSIRYGLLSRKAGAEEVTHANDQIARKNARERRIKYYTLMVYEDADATLLRLFECFMESAPQLVLQIYILIRDPQAAKISAMKDESTSAALVEAEETNEILKYSLLVVSVVSSLISLAWSLVVYHRSLRYTYPHKKNLDCLGSVFQFLWHFSSITARVIALSLFASVYQQWIGVVCLMHWGFMSAWVIQQRTQACNTKIEETFFSFVLGAIYIFSFFNAKDEPTRYKYLFYYTFCFVENTILIVMWALHWHGVVTYGTAYSESDLQADSASWYFYPGIIGHYLAFAAGVLFMVTYYYFFHPSGNINKSFNPYSNRFAAANKDKQEPSNSHDIQNNTRISLESANVKPANERYQVKMSSLSEMEAEVQRPTELHIQVENDASSSRAICVTPSLSSPVLDHIDCLNDNENTTKNLHPPISRSASVPTLTPPLPFHKAGLYKPAHRRLKAMHGKQRFQSGDGQ